MRHYKMAAGIRLLLLLLVGGVAEAAPPQVFATPGEAAQALADAARTGDADKMLHVLGSDAHSLVSSGDAVADKNVGQHFLEEYDHAHTLVSNADGSQTLVLGLDEWPFPIPVVQGKTGWAFDVKAGRFEILARRVGENELNAIQVCLAYGDAQREYYNLNPENDPLQHYADKFLSSPGKFDGLYWPPKEGMPESPLGPALGRASAEGYSFDHKKETPYHGYYYRILSAQGPHAQGGAADYKVKGKLFGGFALVAYPAGYRNSGVMTFIINHDGQVFQKDLGTDTGSIAKAMKRFDPDASWTQPGP